MKPAPALLALSLLTIIPAFAQDDAPPAIPAAEAVKLGVEGIAAKNGDESESGYAFASITYAAAKRLQTENSLAAEDVNLVVELDRYRGALADWDTAWAEAMYAVSGGGTMWARLAANLEPSREDTLATLAERMPLKPGNATPETLGLWNEIGKAIEEAPVPEFGDETTKETWPRQREELHSLWERLSFELQALAEPDAKLLLEHILPGEEQVGMLSGN